MHDQSEAGPPVDGQRSLRVRLLRHRKLIVFGLTAFFYLFYIPYFDHAPKTPQNFENPNENTRVYSVIALVEHGHLYLNEVMTKWRTRGTDMAVREKRATDPAEAPPTLLLPGKPPGMLFVAAPFYYGYYQLKTALGLSVSRAEAVYLCRLFGSILPSILFAFVFYLFLGRLSQNHYLVHGSYFVYLLGTTIYPNALIFVNHSFTTGALFTAFLLLLSRGGSGPLSKHLGYLLAGFLVGLAFSAEYSSALTGLLLGAYALARASDERRNPGVREWFWCRRHLATALLGFSLPIGLSMAYQNAAFGGPFQTAYQYLLNQNWHRIHATGWNGLVAPKAEALWGSFFSPARGMFFFSPFLLLFPIGLVSLFRDPERRLDALFAALHLAIWALFIASLITWTGGWAVGPRYITGIVPTLATLSFLGLRHVDQRHPALARWLLVSTGVLSITLITPAATLFPHLPDTLLNPYYEAIVPLLKIGLFPGNALGLPAWLGAILFGATLLAVIAYLFWAPGPHYSARGLVAVLATLVIIGFHLFFGRLYPVDHARQRWFTDFAKRVFVNKPLDGPSQR